MTTEAIAPIVAAPVAGNEPAPIVTAPAVPDAGPLIGEAPKPAGPIVAEADTVGAVSYATTGDAGLDMALTFVGNLGLGPEDPAMAAAMDGNFGLLKAKLSALGDKAKGWEQYVALAEKAHTDTANATKAKVEADTKVIHDAVGGKDNWNAISKWAGENAEPAEKESVNAALKAGGLAAKAVAIYLQGLYGRAQGTTVEPEPVVQPGAAAKPDASGALTASQYAKEVQALRAKEGFRFESGAAYKQLNARRQAGQRQGI